MQTTGLVRVTVATPQRRVDMALPEHAAVAEILPGLLAHAGDHLADDGGGWLLRRTDGSAFDLDRTLGAHRVRDGEILHLVPRGTDWPELEYDDLVDAIATGSSRRGRVWGPRHTRLAGLAAGAAAVMLGLVAVLRAGPDWFGPATWALGAAAVLLCAGVVLARAIGDAGAGAVAAACALPFAFAGGGLLLADEADSLSAGHLVLAGAALTLAALVGYLGVIAWPELFAGSVTVGVLAVVGGWMTTSDTLEAHETAAVVAGVLLALSPAFAPMALRLSRVPMPVLPRSTADLVRDDPQPPAALVHAAVARADGLLTGMLSGAVVVAAACMVLLARSDSEAAVVLLVVLAAGFLLRARLYPILRQRVPVLVAGIFGLGALVVGPLMADRGVPLLPVLLAVGAAATAAGIVYSTRKPNPYVARFAEYAEILVLITVVPVACSVLGLYGYVRGLGG
ncbi:type VII secretion integral membrane protein EccD [Actinokineospora sp. HUAS TT18]|uniref:type VII secretion integral membrane protein EccD n=1 Tax=Actinokineospora sp. HUAS TT18 TaxID=3447451 RepID=UPI003F527801